MRNPARRLALAALLTACAVPAQANDLQFSIKDGRVTLIAENVTARQIMEAWATIGESQIVNAEKLGGPPLTLRLEDVPERQALDIVLRSAAGYLVAPRPAGSDGPSRFDRILVLATSKAPPAPARTLSAPTPAPFAPPPPVGVDQWEPEAPAEPDAVDAPTLQPYPGPFPGTAPQGQEEAQPQQPQTSPRPGFLPVAPQQQPVLTMPPGYPGVATPPAPIRKPGGGGVGG